jgi:hypothetical protein
MGGNSLKLKILWWAEVIISARALVFFVPVLIDKYLTKSFVQGLLDHLFIVVAAFAALFYLFIGIVSLLGHKFWRLFHFVGVAVVASLTAGLCDVVQRVHMPLKPVYFVPMIFAVVITLAMAPGQGKPRPA